MDYTKATQLLDEKQYVQLKEFFAEANPVDIADWLEPLDKHKTLLAFRMLPKDVSAEVFSHLPIQRQEGIIEDITDDEVAEIMDELFFDDMIDLLEEVPANMVKKIIKSKKPEERNLINQFLNYPDDSAGTLMTIEYVALEETMTVGQAMAHIKETGLTKETIYTCYITDPKRVLKGIVSLRELVVSDEDVKVVDLMDEDVVFVHTHDDQELATNLIKKYGFIALPVVDTDQRLTGIITVDDVIDVIDMEATEDVQKMAGTLPSETAYLETNVLTLAKNRIVWLLVLMVSATLTGSIIGRYESVLAQSVVLTTFIPMLMDTGGNAGSQPSALVIRGLALGEIKFKDFGKVLWKELRVSIICGVVLALINFARLVLLNGADVLVALTVSLTLVATVVIAKLVGSALPMLADKIKLDPAIMAGPLITTIVDTISLLIYFFFASHILGLG